MGQFHQLIHSSSAPAPEHGKQPDRRTRSWQGKIDCCYLSSNGGMAGLLLGGPVPSAGRNPYDVICEVILQGSGAVHARPPARARSWEAGVQLRARAHHLSRGIVRDREREIERERGQRQARPDRSDRHMHHRTRTHRPTSHAAPDAYELSKDLYDRGNGPPWSRMVNALNENEILGCQLRTGQRY